MSQDEDLKERVRSLEDTHREVHGKLSDLSVLVERITVSMENLQQAIIKMSNMTDKIHEQDNRLAKLESLVGATAKIGGLFIAAGAVLIVNKLFGA